MIVWIKNLKNSYYKNELGNATVEYILIISVIVAIIFTLTTFALNLKNHFVTNACRVNCLLAESEYKSYLKQIGATHSDTLLEYFIMTTGNEICPTHKRVTYINGKLQCSVHFENNDIGDGDKSDDTVPFL